MAEKGPIAEIRHVVHISTNIAAGCEHCRAPIGHERFAESVNHFIEEHGYRLLHVGQETSDDQQGKPWHSTVAVLGR